MNAAISSPAQIRGDPSPSCIDPYSRCCRVWNIRNAIADSITVNVTFT